MSEIDWVYFPKSSAIPDLGKSIVACFTGNADDIDSETHGLSSNAVLACLSSRLEELGFRVERDKSDEGKIDVPVLFGRNGDIDKRFYADVYYEERGWVIEVEAGRAVANNQFLKDIFQACMMQGVTYLAIAVRKSYRDKNDFGEVEKFLDTLYASGRLQLPLNGILLIGY